MGLDKTFFGLGIIMLGLVSYAFGLSCNSDTLKCYGYALNAIGFTIESAILLGVI